MTHKAVFGILRTRAEADALVTALQSGGFSRSDVSVLFPDDAATRDFAHQQGTKAPEGGLIGSGVGGLAGGAIGLLAGLGAIALPGLGALIAAGPVMALLGGAAVGAAAGSAVGALVGLGMPEIQAKIYEGKLRDGNLLVAVHTADNNQIQAAKAIFASHRAEDISVTTESPMPKGSAPQPLS